MLENLQGYNLILASNSPRRNELLGGLGLEYKVKVLKCTEESYPSNLKGAEIAKYIALQKAEAFRVHMKPDDLIITADTIVSQEDEVFGKPLDRGDALRMLMALSGKSHFVYTGVCLTSASHQVAFTAETEVFFCELTQAEAEHYVDTYKPYDKAGAYGVQEWIGFVGVERIEGSYFNVMGLPVHQLYTELKRFPSHPKNQKS
ncbi:MAG TPA: Maf-like protein [Bacteroidales bacterium]|nr:Maf-like protein [Bacteroidales bacterium]